MASRPLGRVAPGETVSLAFVLPPRHGAELEDLVNRLYDPADPEYGHYLTPREFAARFGPTQADYDAVAGFVREHGLTITGTHAGRTLLEVTGSVQAVETAFGIHLLGYQALDGHVFRAPDADPVVPAAIAARVSGIIGLSSAAAWHKHLVTTVAQGVETANTLPNQIGTATNGSLAPQDIETAYNLKLYPPANPNDTSGYGGGQVLGLMELDTYNPNDISLYEQKYSIPQLVPTDVLVGTVNSSGGQDEVTLDIELQLAVAPLAKQILVYMGTNSNTGVVQLYQRIADDNLAKAISTSWGAPETLLDQPTLQGEYNAFKQMAAQGQSIFAASGDRGAYDANSPLFGNDSTDLIVDDPSAQPYVCGTGGTTLSVVTPNTDEHYASETTWANSSNRTGSGGGISRVWSIPGYQQGVISAASLGSKTMRNVPDVAFNADPNTGYDIIFNGTDHMIFGGTSCAAPIWAGFTALVNEQRVANHLSSLGFANPPIYTVGKGARYHSDLHDIADGSTNLYYPAEKGYDDATGWGSLVGSNLLTELGSPAPTHVQTLPGDGLIVVKWTSSAKTASYNIYRSTGTGTASQIGSTSSVSFTDTGLSNGVNYHYYVQTVYTGGQSFLTGPISATPAVVTIKSGPQAKPLAGGKATITWTTNVLSNSTVNYGLSASSLTSTQTSSAQVMSHSVTLTGLVSGTTYYYSVSSYDGSVTATSAIFSFMEP